MGNRVQKISIFVTICLLVLPIQAKAQTIGPVRTNSQNYSAGDSIDESLDWSESIGLFGLVGASMAAGVGFYVGITLPFEMSITAPEWVAGGASVNPSFRASGRAGGRIGLDISADLEITLSVGLASFALVDESKDLDLSASFTTPIGAEESGGMETRVEVGGVTIPIVGVEIKAFFGVEADFRCRGSLLSEMSATGSCLVNPYSEGLEWTSENQAHSCSLETTTPVSTSSVSVSFSEIELAMTSFSITLTALFIEFEATGFDTERVSLPLPDLLSASVGAGIIYSGFSALSSSIEVRAASASGVDQVVGDLLQNPIPIIILLGVVAVVVVVVLVRRRR